MGNDENECVLEEWQQRVDDFAGGLGNPAKLSLWQELMRSQLSSRHVELTTQVAPAGIGSANPIALCQMQLSRPMAIDVTINVPNLQTVDVSAGGIFVTWGSTKGASQVAEIDIGRGWRHPFFASFLRVEYVAVRDGILLPGSQAADLEVTATISPASGAQGMPLTCTRFFTSLAITGGVDTKTIPAFAKEVRLAGSPAGNFPNILIEMLFSMNNASGVSIFRQQIDANERANPSYLMNQKRWPIPQRAAIYRVQNFSDFRILDSLTAIAELQL